MRTANAVLNKKLVVVYKWFRNSKMILNPEKFKEYLDLARKPTVKLSPFAGVALPLVDTADLDLFGLTLDDSLNVGKHITKISKKVRKQLDVLCTSKNVLSVRTKLCLYNSFIMPESFSLLFLGMASLFEVC